MDPSSPAPAPSSSARRPATRPTPGQPRRPARHLSPRGRAAALGGALESLPGAALVAGWYARRPIVTSWAFLCAGMVLLVVALARDTGMTLRQHLVVVAATVILSLLCTLIVFLETGSDQDEPDRG